MSRPAEPSSSAGERKRPWLRLTATVALTLAVVGAVASQLDLAAVADCFRRSDWKLMALAVAIAFFFNTIQSAELLKQAVGALGRPLDRWSSLWATVGNLAIHSVMPAGTGNIGRVAFLYRTEGVPIEVGAVAVVGILWLKMVALLALSSMGHLVQQQHELAAGLGALALLVALAGVGSHRISKRMALGTVRSGIARKWVARLTSTTLTLRSSASVLTIGHAVVAVAIELVVFDLCLRAVGVSVPGSEIVALFPLVVIGAKIPVTSMGLGTREALAALLFAAHGEAESIVAATVAFSIAEHVLPSLVGSAVTWPFLRRILREPEP